MDVECVSTWKEFEQKLRGLWQERPSGESCFLFRGQEDSGWPLSTTLERRTGEEFSFAEYYRLVYRIRPQIEAFSGKRWEIPGVPEVSRLAGEYDEFSIEALTAGRWPAYDYMAYLRHHGLPSPLLDWSRSPYVAAYFAFAKAKPDKKASIYALLADRLSSGVRSSDKPIIHRLGPYVRTHPRHFSQQCEYTTALRFDGEWKLPSHEDTLAQGALGQKGIWKFNIPGSERLNVLRSLDEHCLSAFSLFGSEDSLMEAMAFRELDLKDHCGNPRANVP